MRKRDDGDGRPAATVKRKKDRRPLAVEAAGLEERLRSLEVIVVAQSARLDVLGRWVLDSHGVELEVTDEASST